MDDQNSYTRLKHRLEDIVVQVRSKDISLEKSLDLYEEALRLGGRCVEQIDRTDFTTEELAAVGHEDTETATEAARGDVEGLAAAGSGAVAKQDAAAASGVATASDAAAEPDVATRADAAGPDAAASGVATASDAAAPAVAESGATGAASSAATAESGAAAGPKEPAAAAPAAAGSKDNEESPAGAGEGRAEDATGFSTHAQPGAEPPPAGNDDGSYGR
jgi:exonuclease VII small subunit